MCFSVLASSVIAIAAVPGLLPPCAVPSLCLCLHIPELPGLEGFHFHPLRHTFTSNLLSNGAAPKDVQELLGHADVSTTMNIYAHSTREAKRSSARLLDKVVGGD